MRGMLARFAERIPPLVERQGPLTEELLLAPSKFGLGLAPVNTAADAVVRTTCGFCSTGCCLNVHLRQGEAVALTPATAYPVNLGMACPKGWEALAVLDAPDRAVVPLLRDRTGAMRAVSWDDALRAFVARMKAIQGESGPESIAFLSSGQIATEEMALLGALAKFGLGMRHCDSNTRQCMATAAVAYKESFGFDAPPYSYADFEQSDVIVLVGSNLCIAHPILWQRVMRDPHRPEIVVIDPRTTETAMAATQHLPLYPKSDLALFYGLARLLIERGWIDHDYIAAHTEGFEEFAEFVAPYTLDVVAVETQLPADTVVQLARTIHAGARVSFWWTMGVNQSHQAVRTAQAIINLALITGNIGRPGTGANSVTGQCNAMGSRLFSNTTNLLGGHDFAKPEHRAKVAGILGIDEGVIPREAGKPYHQIIEGILRGEIRGLWVIGTNPAHSWINQSLLRDVLDRLDFLVVQDMYHSTETAQHADLVLPAAGWGEKDGTFINSERRIGVIRQIAKAPGQALSDFRIFQAIAQYWGRGEMFRAWKSPETVFKLLTQLSAGQPCDITGIDSYDQLVSSGGIQWPYAAGQRDDRPERSLFEDGNYYRANGRAKIVCETPRPLPEPAGGEFPFVLLTGRGTASQWHTQTRTSKSEVLRKLYPAELYVEIHPADAYALGIRPDELIEVASQRGQLRARAFLTPAVRPGQVFLPMHYEETNRLTDAVFDPYSHQPAYKACAVRVTKITA